MKKFSYILAAALVAGVSASGGIVWNDGDNIAKDKSVVVSYNESAAQTLTDDNTGTRWQTAGNRENDWFFVDLGESVSFNAIEITWEASYPSEYSVYVSTDAPVYTSEEGSSTLTNLEALSKVGTYEMNQDDLVQTLNGEYNGRYVLVYAEKNSENANLYGLSCYEIRIGNLTFNTDTPAAIYADDITVATGKTATVNATIVNKLGETISGAEYTVECADDNVSVNGHEVSCTVMGVYTLTIKSGDISKDIRLNVNFDWDTANNVAANGTAYASHNQDIAQNGLSHTGNGWEVGANETSNTWFYVDLGGEYVIDAVGIDWENAYATDYDLYYAVELEDESTEPAWQLIGNYTQETGLGNHQRTDVFTPVTARYVKILCNASQIWGMHIFKFMVNGTYATEEIPSAVKLTAEAAGAFVGGTVAVKAEVLNQYGVAMENAEITYTLTGDCGTFADGIFTATKAGEETIKAVAGEFSDEITLAIVDGSKTVVPVSAVSNAVDAEGADNAMKAFDGKSGNGNAWTAKRDGYDVPGNENPYFVAELSRQFKVVAVDLDWEGACSVKYSISVSEDGENYTPAYSFDNSAVDGAHHDLHFGMCENVKYIKFESEAYKNEGWGLNLFEMTVYGESMEESVVKELEVVSSLGNLLYVDESTVLSVIAKDQFGDVMTVEPLFTCEGAEISGNEVKFTAAGNYTLVAAVGEVSVSYDFTVVATPTEDTTLAFDNVTVTLNGTAVENHGLGNPNAANLIFVNQDENIVIINLGKLVEMEYLVIKWEAACSSDYTVHVAAEENDLDNAESIFEVSGREFVNGVNPEDRVLIPAVKSRAAEGGYQFIRIHSTGNASQYETKIMSVTAYGKNVNAGTSTSVNQIVADEALVDVYTLSGVLVRSAVERGNATDGLNAGVYVVGGVKTIVR